MPKEYQNSSDSSIPITPATDEFPDTQEVVIEAGVLQRMKSELREARNEVVRMSQELHTNNQIKTTFDHAIGQSSESEYYYKGDVSEQTISQLQNNLKASTRPNFGRQESWPLQEDAMSEKSDTKPFGQAIWGNGARQPQYPLANNGWAMNTNPQGFGSIQVHDPVLNKIMPVTHSRQPRPPTGQSNFRRNNGHLNEPTHFHLDQSFRGGGPVSNPPSRPGSAFEGPRYHQCSGYGNSVGAGGNISPVMPPMAVPSMNMYGPPNAMAPYQPRPIGLMGTRLSPEATEFSIESMSSTPWNSQVKSNLSSKRDMANLKIFQPPSESGQYVASVEPMNYRRLLDRNMNCNWKYIVDKIICNNDQQASIFLQQVRLIQALPRPGQILSWWF